MKRFLSLLLAATLLLSLAACGGSVSGDAGIGNLIGNPTDNSSSTPKVSYTDLLKMASEDTLAAGTLTEHTGYSSLQIDGLDWEKATSYRNDLFGEITWANLGFYHNENDYLECGTEHASYESLYSEDIKRGDVVYVYALNYMDHLLILAGDTLPDERTLWAMVGVPEEYLPEPPILAFDGTSVAEFIPVYTSLDPAARDYNGMPEESLYIQFFHTDVTMDQVYTCIQDVLDMGYTEHYQGALEDPNHDTYMFEGDLPNRVSIYLTYCDGTLMTSVLGPGYGPSDLMMDVLYYNGEFGTGEPSFESQLRGGLWVDICWNEMVKLYIGDQIGTGTGTDSSGYTFWDMVKADRDTYSTCVNKAQSKGYTNVTEQTDNRYVAWKNIDYEGNEVTLWVTINLEGDYFYCAVGLAAVDADRAPTR